MQNKRLAIIAFFLTLSIGNYIRLSETENITLTQFISIFVIGMFTSALIIAIVNLIKHRNSTIK